ncbi:LysR family transcriptional regulator [Paracandidimonas soli]|uniref:LysR family transcriptional regulator n=1 Tax=Paracandidimonas soli TaxID=1917182 RepID=UPI0033425B42
MHLTLRQLEIFVAVAECGSTLSAGRQIALSQSATSGALKELEHLLDVALFDRVGRRLVLNESGRALLPQARMTLDAAREIERQFGLGDGSGPACIRLGASTTIGNYLVPGLVARYIQKRPNTGVDVRIGNTQEIAEAVARFEVDMGLVEGPCNVPDLRVEPWMDDALGIVCSPSHPLALSGKPCNVRALRGATWLLREAGSGTRTAAEHELLPYLDHFESILQLGSTEAIKQAAACGLGLTCLSLHAVQDMLRLGKLVVLPTTLPSLSRRFYVIRHRSKIESDRMREFLSCAEQAPAG